MRIKIRSPALLRKGSFLQHFRDPTTKRFSVSQKVVSKHKASKRASRRSGAKKKREASPPGAALHPRLVGYARVSTDDQTTALQRDALSAAGCDPIFEDAASGVLRSRTGLEQALAAVRSGDTLVIWKLDRLGRSLRDLLDIAETLQERGVALRSLTDHIDTGTAAGRMLYSVLGSVAQFEREVMRERTAAGMRAARRRGEPIGRKRVLTSAQVEEARAMLDRDESAGHVARLFRCSRSTVYRAVAAERAKTAAASAPAVLTVVIGKTQ